MPLALPKVRSDLEYFEQQIEDDEVVIVRDPVRNQFFKYNPLQAAMLRSLDGVRTIDDMIDMLGKQYDVEIPRASAENFIARARKQLLLDVSSADPADDAAVMRLLEKKGLRFHDLARARDSFSDIRSAEGALFVAGMRQLQAGRPAAARDYFEALLEHASDHERAKRLIQHVDAAYVKALAPANSDHPTYPLFDPYRALSFLDRTFGKLVFGPVGVIVLLALLAGAAYSFAITRYPDIELGTLDIAFAVVIAVCHDFAHEMGHGWACMHYGGAVHEIGVMFFYVVTPAPYCDTSSTYLFTQNRHKIAVQLAGTVVSVAIMCLMFISLAVFQPSVPFYNAVQMVLWYILPVTVLNLIPLIKFDGYYALCDYTGMPNLRDRAIRLLKARLGRRLLGLEMEEEELPRDKQRRLLVFAALSVAFTTFWLYFGIFRLLAPVVERFHGPGLVVSALILFQALRKAVLVPFWQLVKVIVRERRTVFTPKRSLVLAVIAVLAIAPWMYPTAVRVDAPFVLVPKQRAIVRVQQEGLVDRVLVHEGDHVRRGQVLARLRNPDLDRTAAVLAAQLEQLDARLAMLEAGKRPEEIAVARKKVAAANASYALTAAEARNARALAKAGIQAETATISKTGAAAVDLARAGAAHANLALLEAGERHEDIAAATAERARVAAQLDKAHADQALLAIESPIDGVVVTKRVEERLGEHLARGDTLVEVDDTSAFYAEIHVATNAPFDQLAPGDRIALESEAAPGIELAATIDHMRGVAESDANADSELVIVTSGFAAPVGVAGIEGHARMFGRERSLAYSMLYLPLQRVFRVKLWSMM